MLIETPRLVIRNFVETDITAFSSIVSDVAVMRYVRDGRILSFKEAGEYIRSCLTNQERFGYARYAVTLKDSYELIGFCGYSWIQKEIDFGWRYAVKWWNQGYGTEAAHAVLDYGKRVLKLPFIVSYSFTENIGSIRIMEKIAMDFDVYLTLYNRKAVRYVKR